KTYRVNLAALQRIRLDQLKEELVRLSTEIYFKPKEPIGWAATLKEYGMLQALQDYDYMELRAQLPDDPFYISGESWLHRKLLEHYLKKPSRDGQRLQSSFESTGVWETSATDPEAAGNNRRVNFRRKWWKGFRERLGMAALGAVMLMAPMWLMVLHNTLWTALVSTTSFVLTFGVLSAAFMNSLVEVLSSTAAYAAVLVVFAGLITEHDRFNTGTQAST
ncbi:hypothetical protein N656DRAFT_720282, partial [Canariomyces notabilis]